MNQPETINILCGTDNNYAPYCGIMLTSLFESNMDSQFEVWTLVDGELAEDNAKKWERLEQKYGHSLHLITMDNERLKDCPINKLNNGETHTYVTLPTYYRLLAAELLPESVHKVIYLDCDIAINGNIIPLWETDLTDKAIACVRDCYVLDKQTDQRLDYPKEKGYFNAGMVVLNLDYWRINKVSDRVFDFIREKADKLKYMDQDALNGALWAEKVFVPERFNFQVVYFAPYFWQDYSEDFQRTLLDECKQAVVIHYCCILKAWDFRYYGGPYYDVWEKYRKKSLWRSAHITKPLRTYAKFVFIRLMFQKKLMKQRQSIWVVNPENEVCYQYK